MKAGELKKLRAEHLEGLSPFCKTCGEHWPCLARKLLTEIDDRGQTIEALVLLAKEEGDVVPDL